MHSGQRGFFSSLALLNPTAILCIVQVVFEIQVNIIFKQRAPAANTCFHEKSIYYVYTAQMLSSILQYDLYMSLTEIVENYR